MTIAFSTGNDRITPTVAGQTYQGLAGNDTYVLGGGIEAGAAIRIDDTQGSDVIQLIDGLAITSTSIAQNAVELTLNNGAVVQILSAGNFDFEIGGNPTSIPPVAGDVKSFTEFVEQDLGATVPAAGADPVTGGPATIGESAGPTFVLTQDAVAGQVDEGTTVTYTVTASENLAADTTFTYEISSTEATAADFATATSGTVTIPAGSNTATFQVTPVSGDGAEFSEDFTVTLTDSSSAAVATVNSTIIDTSSNDTTAPVVDAAQAFTYDENQAGTSAVLGTVTASDNAGGTGVADFAITGGNADGFFDINANGELTLTTAGLAAASNDFETGSNTFGLMVTATDGAGNTSTAVDVTLNVADVDDVAPTLQGTPSISGATISMSFDEALAANSVPGSAFQITHAGGNVTVNNVAVTGNTVTLTLAAVPTGTVSMTYTAPASNPLEDAAGNDVIGFTSAVAVDSAASIINTFSPADGASGVATTSDLVFEFDENVALGTGSITLTNPNDAADTRTITITAGAVAAGSAGTVTINGSTVTVNPTADLRTSVNYAVTIANGTFVDGAGNAYAGGGIPTGGYDFTTQAIAAGTFTLTDKLETLTDSVNTIGGVTGTEYLTSSNNTINATLVNNPAGAQIPSLQNGDQIVDPSSADFDVLNAQFNQAAVTTYAPTLTNVETINIENLGTANMTFSDANVTGTTNYGVTGVGNTGVLVTLSNLSSTGITTKWDVNDPLTLTPQADAAADSITVDVNAALSGVVFTNGTAAGEFDTVNLMTSTQTALDFTYTLGNNTSTTLALSGDANYTIRGLERNFNSTANGGDGSIITNSGAGIVTLRITDDSLAGPTDYSAMTGVDVIRLDADQTAAAGETITIDDTQSLTIANAQTVNPLTVSYGTADQAGSATAINTTINGVAVAGLTANTGIETINVTSSGNAANTLTLVSFTTDAGLNLVDIAGTQTLTITNTDNNVDRIDASDYVAASTTQGGGLTVTAAGTDLVRLDGSAGSDVVNANALDTVVTYNSNGGFDDLTLSAAGSVQTIRTSATTDNNAIEVNVFAGAAAVEDKFVIVGTQAGAAPVANGTANSTTVVSAGLAGDQTLQASFGADNLNVYGSCGQAGYISAASIATFVGAGKTAAQAQTAEQAIEDQLITLMNTAAVSNAAKAVLTDGESAVLVIESDTAGSHVVARIDGQTDGVWADDNIVVLGVVVDDGGDALLAADFQFATA